MHKIQQVSRFFKWVFIVLLIILPIFSILSNPCWIQAPSTIQLGHHALEILNPLSISTKLFIFMLSLIPLAIKLLILYFLIQLFQRYEHRDIFSLRNVNYIRLIGITLFIGQLINPFYQALLSFLLMVLTI